MKLCEIKEKLNILKGNVFTLLHERVRSFPSLLKADQKQEPIDSLERCSELFNRNKQNSLRHCVTMHETRIHYCHQNQKDFQQSGQQSVKADQIEQKTHTSVGCDMAYIFCDKRGILFICYFEKEKKHQYQILHDVTGSAE